MKKKKEKILVAMSGGVDSSVAALLLKREGYDVTGGFMVNYNEQQKDNCWVADYRDAVRVAAKLDIPIIKLDFQKEYKKFVLDYMFREYEAGRTPNPDVLCNKFVKFGVWLDRVKELGFDKLATGHYAKIMKHITYNKEQKKDVTGYMLHVACDKEKDQTYFLHQLSQTQLAHVLFPIGDYTKKQVRELARKYDLPTAEKEESMGICFVGEVPMEEFLHDKVKAKAGDVVLSTGEVIGEHNGLAFYTIGQRHGFSASFRAKLKRSEGEVEESREKQRVPSVRLRLTRDDESMALYVVDKHFDTNELVVGFEDDPLLFKNKIIVQSINWISGQAPKFPLKCKARLRHRQEMQKAELKMMNDRLIVEFKKKQRAVTPGQFAVFYKGKKCLGGGVINK